MAMDPKDMQAVRYKFRLTQLAMGWALGHAGKDATVKQEVSNMERGVRTIPIVTEMLLLMFDRYGIPHGWASLANKGRTDSLGLLLEMLRRHGVPDDFCQDMAHEQVDA